MGHAPGRGHRRKADPLKKRRFRERAQNKKAKAQRRYDEPSKAWEQMSEAARQMRPELDPELLKP
jgi:hypothetical protein